MFPNTKPEHHRNTDRARFDSHQFQNIDLSSILELTDRKTKKIMMTNHGSSHDLKIPKKPSQRPEKVGYHEPFAPMFYSRPNKGDSAPNNPHPHKRSSKILTHDHNNS